MASMDLKQRRGLIGQKESDARLPREYQEVEYIRSNESAYINSGIECTGDLSVHFGYMIFTNTNAAICGGINMTETPLVFRHHSSPTSVGGAYWLQHNASTRASHSISCNMEEKYDLFLNADSGVMILNGITYQSAFALPTGHTTGKNYGIFARIADDGSIQWKTSSIYFFEFYRNNELIGNFIPCYRKRDGEIGMYDLVTETFFTNAGAGSFTKGANV